MWSFAEFVAKCCESFVKFPKRTKLFITESIQIHYLIRLLSGDPAGERARVGRHAGEHGPLEALVPLVGDVHLWILMVTSCNFIHYLSISLISDSDLSLLFYL